MAIFFFVVGLEIKRELVAGELQDRRARGPAPSSPPSAASPSPALIFVAITAGTDEVSGWAIPAATDIAFAVGVLALLGDRISAGLKLLLLSIAIVDDIVAILIIALFYSDSLSAAWLLAAAGGVLAVLALRRLGVSRIAAYVPVGVFVWIAVHESGVHATIAGVALGLLTPTGRVGGREVLTTLEHRLHPISAFAIVPLFALANAGVDFGGGVLGDAARAGSRGRSPPACSSGKLDGHHRRDVPRAAPRLGHAARRASSAVRSSAWRAGGHRLHRVAVHRPAGLRRSGRRRHGAKIGIFAGSLVSGLLGALLLVRSSRGAPPGADGERTG
jgi:NhaA family Na+:H+ antiporter